MHFFLVIYTCGNSYCCINFLVVCNGICLAYFLYKYEIAMYYQAFMSVVSLGTSNFQ